MDYLSVKEIAELWGVSIRMVNYYLNTGRIQGAIRKSGGWLIPANTPHPADLRKSGQRGQEKIPPRMAKCYMPLISRPCDNGFQNLLLTMNDEEDATSPALCTTISAMSTRKPAKSARNT